MRSAALPLLLLVVACAGVAPSPAASPLSPAASSPTRSARPAPSASVAGSASASVAGPAPEPVPWWLELPATPAGVCQAQVDREAAGPELQETCAQGEAAACLALGLARVEGGDDAGAVAPFEQACAAVPGEPRACRERALLGPTVAGGEAGRARLTTKACQGGDGEGCYLAAVGRWTRGDAAGARRELARGCELEFGPACGLLGWMHDAGEGGRKDVAQARAFYEKDRSDPGLNGCHRLASHVATGFRSGMSMCDRAMRGCDPGCSVDCARQAARLRQRLFAPLDLACRRGRALACVVSATTLALGAYVPRVGVVVEQDSTRARTALSSACQAGVALACEGAAIYLQSDPGTGVSRPREAADTFARGCRGGDGPSCVWLGKMIEQGQGRPKDVAAAIAHYERGCALGALLACRDLGEMYRTGDGVKVDLTRAVAFERAALGP